MTLTGNGLAKTPNITVSPSGPINFNNQLNESSSEARTINVSSMFLTSGVTVTAPNGFEVSTDGNTYSTSLTIPQAATNATGGANILLRFSPTVVQSYSGNVTFASTGATTRSIAVSGTAIPSGPFINVNPATLAFGTVTTSGSSQILTFTVDAGNLTAPLVLTPSNPIIELRDPNAGGNFVKSITINPAGGTVSNRTFQVRLTSPVAIGEFNGTITASSTRATSQVITVTANNVSGNTSTINTSPTFGTFSTVPGIASEPQPMTISGTNLLQDITVQVPTYFQVSLDQKFADVTTTGNSLVLRRVGNDVPSTTVYVRFLPPSALSTSGTIFISSDPAVAQGPTVSGTSQPSVALNNSFVEVANVVINTTSASQALTLNAQRVLQPVVITKALIQNVRLNPDNTEQFELSLDNVTFSNSLTITPNPTTYSINRPIYVRYKPTYLGNGTSTLQFQSNDFEVKTAQSFDRNALLSGKAIDVEPEKRNIPTVTRSNTTAKVTFSLPADYLAQGYGEGRIIVASTSSTFPANVRPADGTAYQTNNQTYGPSSENKNVIAPGYYVVYSGANQEVEVGGLDIGTTYYFYTFEYNNINPFPAIQIPGAENYLSPPVPNVIPGIVAPSPLPVTLVSFDAKVRGNQVALTWVTAAELNNKGFEVERSRDGRTFETILSREGKGTTSSRTTYTAADQNPLTGTSYYRLKQVDLDGTTTFSQPVVINFLRSGDINMYPNPVEDFLTIELGGTTEGVLATIVDSNGRVIRSQKLDATGKLDMTNLGAGTYLVTIGEGDAKVTRRIVKK
ncbi:T9SS type A sorting domain-containing protein [Hymenobacter sediminis]|uniref:T9SS type A sorting domain-containing protein n=1 Tax=Hymenobacter sediminis TaxID=2218621 RepID=UPI00138FEBCF|nr:T9SS type A sorting domain-containing protein [Hymenobacter sediminis]